MDEPISQSQRDFHLSAVNQAQEIHKLNEIQSLVPHLLNAVGENAERQGLVDTPKRFAKAMHFLTSGYESNFEMLIKDALFSEPSGDMVLIRDIEFYSLCEHHILPFFGKAHVAYVPNGKVIGLSKVPRLVDAFARRLQVQERLTYEIAQHLYALLDAKGVMVVIEASHLCMMMRGVEKQGSTTVTKATVGAFHTDSGLRTEAMTLLKK